MRNVQIRVGNSMACSGSELVSLLSSRVDWRKQVMEDIMTSRPVADMEKAFVDTLVVEQELRHS